VQTDCALCVVSAGSVLHAVSSMRQSMHTSASQGGALCAYF